MASIKIYNGYNNNNNNNNNINNPIDRIPRRVLVQQQRSPAPKRRTDFSSFFSSSASPSASDPDTSPEHAASEDLSSSSTATAPSSKHFSWMVTVGATDLPSSGKDMDEVSDLQTSRHKNRRKSEVNKTLIFNAKKSDGDESIDNTVELVCALQAASCTASAQKKQMGSSKTDKKNLKSLSIRESGMSNTDKKAGVKLDPLVSSQKSARRLARRLKVMQQLGLAPPTGSTFVRSK